MSAAEPASLGLLEEPRCTRRGFAPQRRCGNRSDMPVGLTDYFAVPARPVVMRWHGGGQLPASLARIAQAGQWIRTEQAAGDGSALQLSLHGERPHGALQWYGPVEARQLEPLVEVLRALGTGQVELDTPATASLLAELRSMTVLDVYVSARCPYCPAVTAACLRLAVVSPLVSVRVQRVDHLEVPPSVRSVPTVLLGDVVLGQGALGEYALAERLVEHQGT